MNCRMSYRKAPKGFTLIEVLLVLTILVVLGAMAVNVISGAGKKAKLDTARAQIGLFDHACPLFEVNVGRMPQSLDELLTAPQNGPEQANWAGPYIDKVPPDPWGNPYQSAPNGSEKPRIWSFGPDGVNGTADDISNY